MGRFSFHDRGADFARADPRVAIPGKAPQLCRKTFAQRVHIELNLERERLHCFNFLVMIFSTFCCLGTYDPLSQISDIHYNLEQQFQTYRVDNIHNHEDIMAFVSSFIDASYRMAPALIDANTKDAIDFARCTDDSVEDVCKLRYWTMDKESEGMRDQILNDQLGPENVRPSRMDCPGPLPNCIDRDSQLQSATQKGLKGRTLGLIPEDPIILKSRLDYPQASLVPLMPVIWQVRSPRRPCDGFGDQYNLGILGAGLCDVDIECDPNTVTSFAGTEPSPAGRDQTFYITYSEDAFFCVDRSEYADVFYDKSWSPWASHEDLTRGNRTESVEFDGKPVFYKFVSDIAYLQRPINGTIQLDPKYCSGSSSTQSVCQEGDGTICDPYDESHPMWAEPASSLLYSTCSLRGEWTRRYLQTPIRERANSFLTLETTELTIAVLVVTPQTAAYRDVQTLIRVIFTFGQGGTIEPAVSLMSTSQTWWWWYIVAGTSVCSSLIYFGMGVVFAENILREPAELRRLHNERLKKVICDVVVGLSVFSAIVTLIIIDMLPPHVTDELIDAFQTNRQDEYFDVLKNIVRYNDTLQKVKGCIFVVACIMFVRLCLFLSLHPRLAVFLSTLANTAAHMVEWFIYFIMIQVFLLYVAWWMFGGARHIEYGTLSRSVWTGLRIFVGDLPLQDTETNAYYIVYLLLYVGSISILLLNILLALVIDAFEEVKVLVSENQTEMSILGDYWDVTIVAWWRRRQRFPHIQLLWDYLKTSGKGDDANTDKLPAITAKELYYRIVTNQRQQVFRSIDHAQEFINHYVYKIVEDGQHVLAEMREDMTFNDGEGWAPPDSLIADQLVNLSFPTEAGKDEEESIFLDALPAGPASQQSDQELRACLQKAEERAEKAEERAEKAERLAEILQFALEQLKSPASVHLGTSSTPETSKQEITGISPESNPTTPNPEEAQKLSEAFTVQSETEPGIGKPGAAGRVLSTPKVDRRPRDAPASGDVQDLLLK